MGKRLRYQENIQESEQFLLSLIKQEGIGVVRDRLRMLLSLKRRDYLTQISARGALGMSERTSQRVWKSYTQEGISGLYPKSSHRGFGKLSSIEISRLLQRLDGNDIGTQNELLNWLSTSMGIHYTQPGVHYLLKRLKVKLKTGRPTNIRKDKAGEMIFKKKPQN